MQKQRAVAAHATPSHNIAEVAEICFHFDDDGVAILPAGIERLEFELGRSGVSTLTRSCLGKLRKLNEAGEYPEGLVDYKENYGWLDKVFAEYDKGSSRKPCTGNHTWSSGIPKQMSECQICRFDAVIEFIELRIAIPVTSLYFVP